MIEDKIREVMALVELVSRSDMRQEKASSLAAEEEARNASISSREAIESKLRALLEEKQ